MHGKAYRQREMGVVPLKKAIPRLGKNMAGTMNYTMQ